MGQIGFFDLSRRYEGLDQKNDPLVLLAIMVPWESFRPKLKAALVNGGQNWVRFPGQFGGLAKVDRGWVYAASFSVVGSIA